MFGKIKSITITMFLMLVLAIGIASMAAASPIIYVSCPGGNMNYVQKFAVDGTYLGKFADVSNVYDAEVGPDGNVYTSDQNKIAKFDSAGNYLSDFVTSGPGDVRFTKWNNGILWTNWWGGTSTVGYDTTGTAVYTKNWGDNVYDCTIGADGRIYAGNYNAAQVVAWDYINNTTEVVATGFSPLALASYGNDIYANSPWGSPATYKISKVDGVWTTTVFKSGVAGGMVAYDGKLFIANNGGNKVDVFSLADASLLYSFGDASNCGGPQGLALAPAPVPEPSSLIALFGGIAGLSGFAIRRKK